eukprot:ANDGO_02935.mRNA.1 6-deoxyerythronolide-B synthase EryA1
MGAAESTSADASARASTIASASSSSASASVSAFPLAATTAAGGGTLVGSAQSGGLFSVSADTVYNPAEIDAGRCAMPASFRDVIFSRGMHFALDDALTILDGNGAEIAPTYTFGDLFRISAALAQHMTGNLGLTQADRCVLVFHTSVEFFVSFFACMLAGVTSVPVSVPSPRAVHALFGIIADCQPKCVLAAESMRAAFEPAFQQAQSKFPDLKHIFLDFVGPAFIESASPQKFDVQHWAREHRNAIADADGSAIVFMQYSSGTTSSPKGICIRNRNLVTNCQMVWRFFSMPKRGETHVSWLPVFHDMGLMLGVLLPMYAGAKAVLLSPDTFVRNPALWLLACTKYNAVVTGAPNFAYELCIRKVDDKMLDQVNLQSLRTMFSGAELVRADTVKKFFERFVPRGLRTSSYAPCYGMAETVVFACGRQEGDELFIIDINDLPALSANPWSVPRLKSYVGCGRTAYNALIIIVNPESLRPCSDGQEGEVWLSSPSVSDSYFGKPAISESTMHATLPAPEFKGHRFLRTGDVGFLYKKQLFVTGRIKDIIKINGASVFPTDVEYLIESRYSIVKPGCSAVFSVSSANAKEESIMCSCELRKGSFLSAEVFDSIAQLIWKEMHVSLGCVVFVTESANRKTTSGKISRYGCRQDLSRKRWQESDAVLGWKFFIANLRDAFVSPDVSDVFIRPECIQKASEVDAANHVTVPARSSSVSDIENAPVSAAVQGHASSSSSSSSAAPSLAALPPLSPLSMPSVTNASASSIVLGCPEPHLAWTLTSLEAKIRDLVSQETGVPASDFAMDAPLSSYSLTSVSAVQLSAAIESEFHIVLEKDFLFQNPSLRSLILCVADFLGLSVASSTATMSSFSVLLKEPSVRKNTNLIAIVGYSSRFPGASSPEVFWQSLIDGAELVARVPINRFRNVNDPSGEFVVGHYLEQIRDFDYKFWNMSYQEACMMDPQQRLIMELVVEAVQRSGMKLSDLKGTSTGVFTCTSPSGYPGENMVLEDSFRMYYPFGSSPAISANRISYFLDLHGISVNVDTACSSSLTAIDLACLQILEGRCNTAFVGGANVVLDTAVSESLELCGFLSPDKACKAFEEGADGYARGEGGVVMILKKYEDALRDGDCVFGVIGGRSVNQNGNGLTISSPNFEVQSQLLRTAVEASGIGLPAVSYVECHGTGTRIGDLIEAKALGSVFRESHMHSPLLIGSVKSNAGHLESCAGLAGLLKALLIVQHRCIPPSLLSGKRATHIDFEGLRLEVVDAVRHLDEQPLAVGVSSFGFGGTNAHVILLSPDHPALQESKLRTPPPEVRESQFVQSDFLILPVSARSNESLQTLCKCLSTSLETVDPLHVSRTLCSFRDSFPYRKVIVASGIRDAMQKLSSATPSSAVMARDRVGFVFSGQGTDWPGMGRALLRSSHGFAKSFNAIDAIVKRLRSWSLLSEILWNDSLSPPRLSNGRLQVLLIAFQISFVAMLQSDFSIAPSAVLGHSIGEIAAFHVAGVISLEDAIHLAVRRGEIMDDETRKISAKFGMLAASLSESAAKQLLSDFLGPSDQTVSLSAVNSPLQVVFGGRAESLQQMCGELSNRGIRHKMLPMATAFHTKIYKAASSRLEAEFAFLKPCVSSIVLCSSYTGRVYPANLVDKSLGTGSYWGNQMSAPVQFHDAFCNLLQSRSVDVVIEIGPSSVLAHSMEESIDLLYPESTVAISESSNRLISRQGLRQTRVLGASQKNEDEVLHVISTLSALWECGHGLRLESFGFSNSRSNAHVVPVYQWDRTACWVETSQNPLNSKLFVRNVERAMVHLRSPRLMRSRNSDPFDTHRRRSVDFDTISTPSSATNSPSVSVVSRFSAQSAIVDALCRRLQVAPSDLNQSLTLVELGMDSISMNQLRSDIESLLNRRLKPEVLLGKPVSEVVKLLTEQNPVLSSSSFSLRAGALPHPISLPAAASRLNVATRFDDIPEMVELETRLASFSAISPEPVFYRVQDGIPGAETLMHIGGEVRKVVSYSHYNYLGLNGNATVSAAAKTAIDQFGTSVSGSRILSGEKTVHTSLERLISRFLGAEDSLVMSAGHAVNESFIGHIVGDGDAIFFDEESHNSIIQGTMMSGAARIQFAHNSHADLATKLETYRKSFRRALIVIEGLYSMSGDYPDLQKFVDLKKTFDCGLMIDEAHSIGTLGSTGRGICELCDVMPGDVDILMGTLSKSFASCGGYLAGSSRLIQYLRYTLPGYIFSAGITPANTAAAAAVLELISQDSTYTRQLRENSNYFMKLLAEHGLETLAKTDSPIIPVVVGADESAISLSLSLLSEGIFVNPAVYPSVPKGSARLRFFMTALHTQPMMTHTADVLARLLKELPACQKV